ncbi:MAG: response regulator [Candidatus Omnitrophica bacterium]|nr:response regulator [Candidatus Omnitrophota bacterium]
MIPDGKSFMAASKTSKRILIIDDEEILIKTFSLLLRRNGYAVSAARDSREALTLADREEIDLILCDIRMPETNGVEIIKAIRAKKDKSAVPVIFITGYADEQAEADAKQLQPLAFFYKPFDNSDILETIKGALG